MPRVTSRDGTSIAYDATLYGRPPTERLAAIGQPTLVATSGSQPFFEAAADAVAATIPHASRRVVERQSHFADPKILASVLAQFFGP